MTEWTQERIDEQKKICALNTEIAYSLKYIEAARLNYEAAISEIERLQKDKEALTALLKEVAVITEKMMIGREKYDARDNKVRCCFCNSVIYAEDHKKGCPVVMYKAITNRVKEVCGERA